MYRSTHDETATEGAALLDRHLAGWEGRIDLDALDMGSSEQCVLGQLYGGYGEGAQYLGMFGTDARAARGFTLRRGEHAREHRELTAAWRRLIEARRADAC